MGANPKIKIFVVDSLDHPNHPRHMPLVRIVERCHPVSRPTVISRLQLWEQLYPGQPVPLKEFVFAVRDGRLNSLWKPRTPTAPGRRWPTKEV